MTNDLRAAAANLLRYANGEWVYDHGNDGDTTLKRDIALLAHVLQSQAEPTGCPTPGACSCPGEDDGEPVTDEWLYRVLKQNHMLRSWRWVSHLAVFQIGRSNILNEYLESAPCKTRRDVRRLCEALGVTLKGE